MVSYLSVCSGIEAASVAWHPLGWRPLAFSEIEPFPRAVLQHHYPDVPLHGDFTVLRDQPWIADADVLVGGTPCQAFSVAGLRNSLADERGNLSMEFVRLADAIDNHRRVAGKDSAIIVWENVPGVLSVKDNAFGCFLAGLAGDVDPYDPPRGKWTNAGVVDGPARTVAWRILDAQYFGVAQRRRRVFVVASSRKDFDPAAVLFEFQGVRRDTAPRRETREGVAGGVEIGPGGGRLTDLNPTLGTRAKDGPIRNQLVGAVIGPAAYSTKLHTTSNQAGKVYEEYATSLDANSPPPAVFQPVGVTIHGTDKTARVASYTDIAGCLRADVPGRNENSSTMVALRHEALGEGTGFGIGEPGDPSFTLTKGHSHAIAFHPTQDPISSADVCRSIGANDNATAAVMRPIGIFQDSEYGVQQYDSAGTLRAGRIPEHQMAIQPPAMQVRRLTPVECERLQGFPDNYTAIPWRKKPSDLCPDGPRYKALGNSMAVPVMRWIGRRIVNARP